MTKGKQLMSLCGLGVVVAAAFAMGFAQPGKDAKKGIEVGAAAPAFTLKDTEGKDVSLESLRKDGKIVIAFWFNPDCPFVVKHFEKGGNTFNDMHTKYKDKKVAIVAINSSAAGEQGSGKERNTDAKKKWKVDFPILLDESGETGKAFGAKRTPECFVIGTDGKIAYMGAPDDNAQGEVGKTNYVVKAVDELLAGKKVTTTSTQPYGCPVKYKK